MLGLIGACTLGAHRYGLALSSKKLKVSAAPAIFGDMFRSIVQVFGATHADISVDLNATSREYDDLMQTTLREALIRELPDVSFQGINQIRLLSERGIAQSLDPFAEQLLAGGEFYGQGIGKIGSRMMAIPIALSTPVLFLNRDLIDQYSPSFGHIFKTWPEITDLAARLSSARRDILGGFFQYSSGGNWLFQALVTSFAGNMASLEATNLADRQPFLRSLAVLQEFGKSGQSKLDMSQGQARQAFCAGRIGVLVDSSSASSYIQRQIGGRFRVEVAPFPVESSSGRVPPAGFASVMFTQDPIQQRLALQLMKFFLDVPAQVILATHTGYIPVNQAAFKNPRVASLYREKSRAATIQQLNSLAEWHAFPGINSFKITDVIRDILNAVLTLQIASEEALSQIEHAIHNLLTQ